MLSLKMLQVVTSVDAPLATVFYADLKTQRLLRHEPAADDVAGRVGVGRHGDGPDHGRFVGQ